MEGAQEKTPPTMGAVFKLLPKTGGLVSGGRPVSMTAQQGRSPRVYVHAAHPTGCRSEVSVELRRLLLSALLLALAGHAFAGNCLVQGGRKIGDCENVHVGPARPLVVKQSGDYSGNFAQVTVRCSLINISNILRLRAVSEPHKRSCPK